MQSIAVHDVCDQGPQALRKEGQLQVAREAMYVYPEAPRVGVPRLAVTAGSWFWSWFVVYFEEIQEIPT